MEEKEITNQELENKTEKNKFSQYFLNKKVLIAAAIFVSFIVIEFTTDIVEIVLGNVIELTNPFRPKAGTIWEYENKGRLADDQLKQITQNLTGEKVEITEINNLSELRNNLEEKENILITSDRFKQLYNQIPPRFSYEVISPFDLLKLSHSHKWTWTKIIKSENNLNFYFLDGDKQILMDTYPPLTVLYNIPHASGNHNASLDSMSMFKGRTFTAEQFFNAFDDFPNAVKLQLINNPYLLIKWDENIRKVGISRYSFDNTVLLGFELNQGIYTEVYTFESSELAANYLIARLNELYPELNLLFPERKYREYQYYEYD